MGYIYKEIRKIIEDSYSSRFSLHKSTQDIYMDGNLFSLSEFRQEVLEQHHVVLENDKYICELGTRQEIKYRLGRRN